MLPQRQGKRRGGKYDERKVDEGRLRDHGGRKDRGQGISFGGNTSGDQVHRNGIIIFRIIISQTL